MVNDRTASAIRRLALSSDFLVFKEQLSEDLAAQIKILVSAKDETVMRRAQGTTQYLQALLNAIDVGMK